MPPFHFLRELSLACCTQRFPHSLFGGCCQGNCQGGSMCGRMRLSLTHGARACARFRAPGRGSAAPRIAVGERTAESASRCDLPVFGFSPFVLVRFLHNDHARDSLLFKQLTHPYGARGIVLEVRHRHVGMKACRWVVGLANVPQRFIARINQTIDVHWSHGVRYLSRTAASRPVRLLKQPGGSLHLELPLFYHTSSLSLECV